MLVIFYFKNSQIISYYYFVNDYWYGIYFTIIITIIGKRIARLSTVRYLNFLWLYYCNCCYYTNSNGPYIYIILLFI